MIWLIFSGIWPSLKATDSLCSCVCLCILPWLRMLVFCCLLMYQILLGVFSKNVFCILSVSLAWEKRRKGCFYLFFKLFIGLSDTFKASFQWAMKVFFKFAFLKYIDIIYCKDSNYYSVGKLLTFNDCSGYYFSKS